MSMAQMIEEYKLQKQKVEEARKILQENIENISFTGGEREASIPPEKKNKCIGAFYWTFVSYEEWRYKDDINLFTYCPKFSLHKECKNVECPGHDNHLKYRKARRDFDKEEAKLWEYPLIVRLIAKFQNNK